MNRTAGSSGSQSSKPRSKPQSTTLTSIGGDLDRYVHKIKLITKSTNKGRVGVRGIFYFFISL